VAHNSIWRQEYISTGEHAASTPASAEEPIQRKPKARKPNRNWTCVPSQMMSLRPECSAFMSAEAHLQLTRPAAIESAITHSALLIEPTGSCRVLVVDDDQLIISRISSLLEQSGYQVCAARSGEEAMRVLDTTSCQIVITDWHMPDMDGLDLCRSIRSSADNAHIYILILSVRNGSGDILAGLSAGADDYVIKGATAEEILARLEVGKRIS
jgi:PleD family two-component response regulator